MAFARTFVWPGPPSMVTLPLVPKVGSGEPVVVRRVIRVPLGCWVRSGCSCEASRMRPLKSRAMTSDSDDCATPAGPVYTPLVPKLVSTSPGAANAGDAPTAASSIISANARSPRHMVRHAIRAPGLRQCLSRGSVPGFGQLKRGG